MNKVIEITIRNKVGRIASSPIIVGKNKDYIVRFDFDEDWYKYDTKTARFSQDGEYQDIIFAGNECSMPALDGGKVVEVGVYAGDISTTTPAYLKVQKSIIDDDGVPADPTPDVYAQLMVRLNELEAPAAVLYTQQNLTDEQKAQARDNIGVNESLGMTGATVGQVPVVKTVDENGVPTEWEAGDSKPFVVTVTYGDNYTLTADKTHAEIVAAYAAGVQINAKIVNHPYFMMPIILPLFINISDETFAFGGSGVIDGSAKAMTAIDANGSWRVELAELAMLDNIPTGVFTINLVADSVGNITADHTFAEIQDAYYNGKVVDAKFEGAIVPLCSISDSEAFFAQTNANSFKVLTVNFACTSDNVWSMSQNGFDAHTLGITGATVGQTVKIKAVDENGVPTEWEAADAASGESGWKLLKELTLESDIYTIVLTEDTDGNAISCMEIFAALYIPETFTGSNFYVGAFYPNAIPGMIAIPFSTGERHYATFYVTPMGGIAAVSTSTNAYSVPTTGVTSFAVTPGGDSISSNTVFVRPDVLSGIRFSGDWNGNHSYPAGTKVLLYAR